MVRSAPSGTFVVGKVVIGALVLATLALTGCSGPTQTKAAACTTLIASLDSATADLNTGLSTMSTDPTSAKKSLSKGAASLHATVKSITNSDVKPVGVSADSAVSSLASQVTASLSSASAVDSKKLSAASTDVSVAFADIRKLCA